MVQLLQLPSPRPSDALPTQRKLKRVGIVGLGKQALEDHLPAVQASDAADLVAVCDEDPGTTREQQYGLRVPGYTDVGDMLSREQLDLIVVCVPHNVGRRVIEAAAEHGVHVLKEKPFATTLGEAQRLAALCSKANIELIERRFNPIYTTFSQLADQIGTPFMIDARYTIHVDDPSDGWRGQVSDHGPAARRGQRLVRGRPVQRGPRHPRG